eukprot:TRINITY_DN7659_c0_g1_i2.p1 TRINITY_DN7659_c0_g1~~TRINITY_DN7659_c0_g1_i2.p1  ORF type:complete len:428 (+),score=102.98 TRINITY_DN7659_c0_g1_i2:439-1722(+)
MSRHGTRGIERLDPALLEMLQLQPNTLISQDEHISSNSLESSQQILPITDQEGPETTTSILTPDEYLPKIEMPAWLTGDLLILYNAMQEYCTLSDPLHHLEILQSVNASTDIVIDKTTRRRAILKRHALTQGSKTSQDLLEDVRLYFRYDIDGVVDRYAVFLEPQSLSLLEEKSPIDLREFLLRKKPLQEGLIRFILKKVIEVVKNLHENEVVDGHIVPQRVSLFYGGDVKLSRPSLLRSKISTMSIEGAWTPPEVLGGETPSSQGDVYSIGALAWFMLCGEDLFHGIPAVSAVFKLASRQLDFPSETNSDLRDLIENCLHVDPKQRRRIAELLQHPFFVNGSEISLDDFNETIRMVGGVPQPDSLFHQVARKVVELKIPFLETKLTMDGKSYLVSLTSKMEANTSNSQRRTRGTSVMNRRPTINLE